MNVVLLSGASLSDAAFTGPTCQRAVAGWCLIGGTYYYPNILHGCKDPGNWNVSSKHPPYGQCKCEGCGGPGQKPCLQNMPGESVWGLSCDHGSALSRSGDSCGSGSASSVSKTGTSQHLLELQSPVFGFGETIPAQYSCQGKGLSPALTWWQAPQGTKSFALIMDDPDAAAGKTWVHWVLYDLPTGKTDLPEGLPQKKNLPDGSKQGRCRGMADSERFGYCAPCPPAGRPHRYYFRFYALDKMLGLPPGVTNTELIKAMKGHVLGQTNLVGSYQH